jgi:type II secretion system protein N
MKPTFRSLCQVSGPYAKSEDAILNIFPRIALGGHSIQVEDTVLKGSLINNFSPFPNLLKGDIQVQGNFDIQGKQIETGNFRLKSKNLLIPPQNISGFALPAIALRVLDFAGTITKKKMYVKALRLGDSKSAFQAEFKGDIALSLRNISFSTLNLQGKFRIDDSVLNTIGLLRIMLNGKKKKDNFYFLQLKGTMARPQPVFVDPA